MPFGCAATGTFSLPTWGAGSFQSRAAPKGVAQFDLWLAGFEPARRVTRSFRGFPVGGRAVQITLGVGRVGCQSCEMVQPESAGCGGFRGGPANVRKNPRPLRVGAFPDDDNSQRSVPPGGANGMDLVREIQRSNLQQRFKCPKLNKLRQHATDEICIGKQQPYVTLLLDLVSRAV